MATTAIATEPMANPYKRKQSVGAIQFTSQEGEMRTVQLEELTDADRELAEKFGYNPVSYATVPRFKIKVQTHQLL
jgi:hypothetical protein